MRGFTHVSYWSTAASVNAGRVERTGTYGTELRPAIHAMPGRTGSRDCQPLIGVSKTRRESGPNVSSLLVAFVVSFTVAGSLALGIALAYTSVLFLLHAFADRSKQPRPSLLLVQSQSQMSGD